MFAKWEEVSQYVFDGGGKPKAVLVLCGCLLVFLRKKSSVKGSPSFSDLVCKNVHRENNQR